MFSNQDKSKENAKELDKLAADLKTLEAIVAKKDGKGVTLAGNKFREFQDGDSTEKIKFDEFADEHYPLLKETTTENRANEGISLNEAKSRIRNAFVIALGVDINTLNLKMRNYNLKYNNFKLGKVYHFLKTITKSDYKPTPTFLKEQTELKKDADEIEELRKHILDTIGTTGTMANELKAALKFDDKDGAFRFEVTSKVFPSPFTNSKGFRIGDYKVAVNPNVLPFNGIDQANHYLYNLFDYATYQGTPQTNRKQERDINSFFKSKNTQLEAFVPIKYPDPEKAKVIQAEQEQLREENKKIRENFRKLQNELVEIGFSGNPEQREKIRESIEKEIEKETDAKDGSDQKQAVLAEYLNAIDEVESGSKGFVPPFLTTLREKKGGTQRSRKPRRKCRKTRRRRSTARK